MAGSRPFAYRDAIAVLQIVAFSIFLCLTWVLVCTGRNGWLGLTLFSLARLVGAACLLATFQSDSRDVWSGVFVCEALAIALLAVLLKSLLARANRWVGAVGSLGFLLPEVLSLAGVGVTAAGFWYAQKGADFYAPNPITQSAVSLFSAMYLYTVGLFARLWAGRDRIPREERWLLWCFAGCMPFMAARIVYSFIFVITGDERFGAVRGDPTIYLFLVAANEIGIVAAWASTVMKLGPMPSPAMVVKMQRRMGLDQLGAQGQGKGQHGGTDAEPTRGGGRRMCTKIDEL